MEVYGTQVIVHLGKLPGYVGHYASIAAAALPGFDTALIVDSPRGLDYPGVRVLPARDFVSPELHRQIDNALSALGIDSGWRGGYWRRIFLRFALVDAFMGSISGDGLAVQLESDVLSCLSSQLLVDALPNFDGRCYMPFIDSHTAGPGIMISSSPTGMSQACRLVIRTLLDGISPSDMEALARDSKVVTKLPSQAAESDFHIRVLHEPDQPHARVVFDAAATGQYLFGIDPRNNKGKLEPGYLETRGGLDPGKWSDWRIVRCADGKSRVACTMESETAVFANVHVHSKISVNAPSTTDPQWASVLRVANRLESAKPRMDFSALRQIGIRGLLRR